jgi:transposase-like protein
VFIDQPLATLASVRTFHAISAWASSGVLSSAFRTDGPVPARSKLLPGSTSSGRWSADLSDTMAAASESQPRRRSISRRAWYPVPGDHARRRWSVEQKREIAAESLEPGISPITMARRYGISSRSTLHVCVAEVCTPKHTKNERRQHHARSSDYSRRNDRHRRAAENRIAIRIALITYHPDGHRSPKKPACTATS